MALTDQQIDDKANELAHEHVLANFDEALADVFSNLSERNETRLKSDFESDYIIGMGILFKDYLIQYGRRCTEQQLDNWIENYEAEQRENREITAAEARVEQDFCGE